MLRIFASLLIALGLTFAPAMMARASAAPVAAMEHCQGAMPAKHQGKADAKPCCTTACPATAALPSELASGSTLLVADVRTARSHPVLFGLDPEKATPPPRTSPVI